MSGDNTKLNELVSLFGNDDFDDDPVSDDSYYTAPDSNFYVLFNLPNLGTWRTTMSLLSPAGKEPNEGEEGV